jgi:hypothetical protein
MKISLMEDNGFLFGGVPSLVVVEVTFDDGRVVRFPYEAGSTIADLYSALGGMNKSEVIIANGTSAPVKLAPSAPAPVKEFKERLMPSGDTTKIEKGDIVKCVFLENRNDHAGKPGDDLLFVGNKYRVTKVTSGGYEVLDDDAPMKFKLFLMRHEVELFEKGKPIAPKVLFPEREFNCPKCNLLCYCGLQNGFFTGKCDCGQEIKISKQEADRGQSGNQGNQAVEPGGSSGVVSASV